VLVNNGAATQMIIALFQKTDETFVHRYASGYPKSKQIPVTRKERKIVRPKIYHMKGSWTSLL